MSRHLRAAALLVAAAAALVVAGTAAPRTQATAYTPFFSVSYNTFGTPSTAFRFDLGSADNATAQIKLYAPGQAQTPASLPRIGRTVGTASGTFFSRDRNAQLPAAGPIVAVDPATVSAPQCAPGGHAGAWQANVQANGRALTPITLFLDPTSGLETELGAYRLVVCFASPSGDASTAGRSALGAQPLTLTLKLNGVFLHTAGFQLRAWRAFFTPYQTGKNVQDTSSLVEARSWVGGSIQLKARFVARTHRFQLLGGVHQGVAGIPGLRVAIYKGLPGQRLKLASQALTNRKGVFRTAGNLRPLRTTFFQARVRVPARLHVAGCKPVLPGSTAPCVGATLGGWTAASSIVRIKL